MIRTFYIALVLLSSWSLAVNAQSPQVAATPPAEGEVVKISTNLIQVDVTVTDKKGKIITDLKPEEIEIYENGEKQKITNFSFVSSARAVNPAKPAGTPDPLTPAVPSSLKADRVQRAIALVVDDLSLSFESVYYTRRALKKFVDEQMQEGDLVAIIRTGAGIGALQQFTADKRVLYAAIEKVRWNMVGTGQIGAFAPFDSGPAGGDSGGDSDQPGPVGQSLEDFRSAVFATGTLGALRYIVGGMGELPGRKSVVLFSDGFKLFEEDSKGFKESGRVMQFLRQLVDTANRSSVVFYTIDPRGLVYTGLTAADSVSNPSAVSGLMSKRSAQLFDTQEGLSYLAAETGGLAVKNNNDLSGGVRRILEDQSYYLVAYEPDGDTFDAAKRKFNQLSVKVLRPGTSVRYRSGFFNVATTDRPVAGPGLTSSQQLQHALVSPFAVNGISLHLNALFASDKRSPVVRSLIHVDARDLAFSDDGPGSKTAMFKVLAVSFGDNGQVVDQLSRSYTMTTSPAQYERLMQHGFVYNLIVPIKKPGAYQFRVAIRDEGSGKVGSASQFIEVPDVKKDRLSLSSLVIDSITGAEWDRSEKLDAAPSASDPLADTARRIIKQGNVLRYVYEVYNPKLDSAKQPHLTVRIRVFREGKLILDGVPKPIDFKGQPDTQAIKAAGAINIGREPEGDYVLQVIVTDELGKKKQQVVSQALQFQVVK
jgi:VWFA-related protein